MRSSAERGGNQTGKLPERVLQFGTGMLLRSLVSAAVDAANRTGAFRGSIAVVQSTGAGVAGTINRQGGRFALVEAGLAGGKPVQRVRQIESISRALVADQEWGAIRDLVSSPELRIIVSNVTEAGFRLDDVEPAIEPGAAGAPHSYPAKLTDLLYTRFVRLPDGPSLLVIPTELVVDNGAVLEAMVVELSVAVPDPIGFRAWIASKVRFCSSLVDRITTGAPPARIRAAIERELDDHDELITMTEPYALWAIEGDPVVLHEIFPVDGVADGAVVFAPSIGRFREQKLRMLNGSHTALAPYALMRGVGTVREAIADPELRPLLERLLFREIVPTMSGSLAESESYARQVLERFANPSLDHQWRVIATNQTAKVRVRVVPTIIEFVRRFGAAPEVLSRMFAVSLLFACEAGAANVEGWWGGDAHRIVDVDRRLISRHSRGLVPASVRDNVPGPILARFVDDVLGDATIWGQDLRALPTLVDAVTNTLLTIQPRDF